MLRRTVELGSFLNFADWIVSITAVKSAFVFRQSLASIVANCSIFQNINGSIIFLNFPLKLTCIFSNASGSLEFFTHISRNFEKPTSGVGICGPSANTWPIKFIFRNFMDTYSIYCFYTNCQGNCEQSDQFNFHVECQQSDKMILNTKFF